MNKKYSVSNMFRRRVLFYYFIKDDFFFFYFSKTSLVLLLFENNKNIGKNVLYRMIQFLCKKKRKQLMKS